MQNKNKATPAVLATPRGLAETLWEVPTMQAYASAELAPAAELRLMDRHPTISGSTSQVATGNVVLDELLAHLAEIVAAKVIDRFARQETAADEWLDTRGASEYLGIHRDSVRRLAAERAIPAEQACLRHGQANSPLGFVGTARSC